jgi:alkylated DNA nucleotide flippase Atl1
MKAVPRGKLITLREICAILAAKHRANCGCPLTTGIFSWIAAHAGEELAAAGHEEVTPYWRTLKTGGMLNDKYPGGIPNLTARLEAEGHRVRQKGRNTVVADYEASLWRVFAAGEDEDA